MIRKALFLAFLFASKSGTSQLRWEAVDSLFGHLPASIQVFKSTDSIEGRPNIAFYVVADLRDKELTITCDSALNRRLTPQQFYERNHKPFITVNCTFFSFDSNRNLSLLVRKGKTIAYNNHIAPGKGRDTLLYTKFLGSALGVSKKRKADVAWVYADSTMKWPVAVEENPLLIKDSVSFVAFSQFKQRLKNKPEDSEVISKWKMETAIGGGPVLIHNGVIRITNNEERKFAGKAIADKHPRTAIGYTADNKLIILAVQGRFPGTAEGASLTQTAQMLKALGCVEALNLDGGGSSCLLVNGKETIIPSDNKKQRATPAVFLIQ